jgi:plastocyanin domain-containing protein
MNIENIKKGILVIISLGIIFFVITSGNSGTVAGTSSVKDGSQEATIKVKAGYTPNEITLKAGVPTRLVFETKNTYDCSLQLNIPKLDFSKTLPSTGSTELTIASQEAGSEITGSCGMRMYGFKLKFI